MVTVRNDFHGTEARLRPGLLSARTVRRVRAQLCPSDCQCGDTLGTRGNQHQNDGSDLMITEELDGRIYVEAIHVQ